MISLERAAIVDIPQPALASLEREPFGFGHALSELEMLSLESIEALSRRYRPEDAFVAAGARSAETAFYSVEHSVLAPHEAIAQLDSSNVRVLLKRPENYDARFRQLLDGLFATIGGLAGTAVGDLARLQSSILISSSATITPFHFDPEVSFFFQIEGPKTYHVYSPTVLTEHELEQFYRRGVVDIAQIDLHGRDAAREHVFELGPGKGMHQPRNAPHWVQTSLTRSISYVVSYETNEMRAVDRTRAFNFYLRGAGVRPEPIGQRPRIDACKSAAMRVAFPVRNVIGRTLRRKRHS
jgi:hypothetical protein